MGSVFVTTWLMVLTRRAAPLLIAVKIFRRLALSPR